MGSGDTWLEEGTLDGPGQLQSGGGGKDDD